jgi:hypothetical protein
MVFETSRHYINPIGQQSGRKGISIEPGIAFSIESEVK